MKHIAGEINYYKHQTRLERPVRDKHSWLLRTFVNYGRKKFYKIGKFAFITGFAKWN